MIFSGGASGGTAASCRASLQLEVEQAGQLRAIATERLTRCPSVDASEVIEPPTAVIVPNRACGTQMERARRRRQDGLARR
jgi:hypothetical protein